jgi:hypothetical protein
LNRLHDQSVAQLSAGQYEASLATLAELQKRTSQFTDLDELREQANEGIRRQQLKASLDESYQQAQAHLKRYDFQGALAIWQSIQSRREDLDYPDPQDVEGQARRGLANGLYNQAVAALAEGDPPQALACWQQVQQIEPNYPDSQRVVQRAQDMSDKIAAEERERLTREAAERERLAREARVEAEERARRNKQLRLGLLIAGGIIVLIVSGLLLANLINSTAPATTPVPSAAPTSTATPTRTPTSTPSPAATPTAEAIGNDVIAQAIQPSTIYQSPSTNSRELRYVQVGEPVTVTGRAESGSWLYVQSAGGEAEGYVASDRFQWSGDVTALPVETKPGFGPGVVGSVPPPEPATPSEGLTLDLWSLPGTGKCLADGQWSISIFMSGHGAYRIYNYFWNDQPVGGPTSDRITFEITATGNRVQGVGRVTSGNLQTQQALIVRPPLCP